MPSTLRWRPPGRPQTALSRRDAGRPQSKRRWVVSPVDGKGRAAAAAFLRPARMRLSSRVAGTNPVCGDGALYYARGGGDDRKSTRLNSSHLGISYAVFCLKKKK